MMAVAGQRSMMPGSLATLTSPLSHASGMTTIVTHGNGNGDVEPVVDTSRLFGGNHWKGPHVQQYRTSGMYALVVGCNRFNDSDAIGPLKHCVDDSKSLADMLEKLGYTVTLLNDEQSGTLAPTFQNVLKALTELCRDQHKYDTVLVSFSTHGVLRGSDRKMVLLFQDTIRAHIDQPNCALPLEQVQDILWKCKSKNRIVLVDTCSSGLDTGRGDSDDISSPASIAAATRQAVADAEAASARLLQHQTNGVCMLSACTARQKAHEHEGLGVFTRHVIEALLPIRRPSSHRSPLASNGVASTMTPLTCRAAKPGSNVITFGDLAQYVTERVSAYCRKFNLAPMSPTTFQHSSGDPIIVDFFEMMEEYTDEGIQEVLQSADGHESKYSLAKIPDANSGGWSWPTTPTPLTSLPSPPPTSSSALPMKLSSLPAATPASIAPTPAVSLTVLPIPSIPITSTPSLASSPVASSSLPSNWPSTGMLGNIATSFTSGATTSSMMPSMSSSFTAPTSPPSSSSALPFAFNFSSALFALPPPSAAMLTPATPAPPRLEERPFVSTKVHDSLMAAQSQQPGGTTGGKNAQQLVDIMTSVGWLQPHDEEQSTRINMEYVVPILREAYATWIAIVSGARNGITQAHPVAATTPQSSVMATMPIAVGVTSRGLAPHVAAQFAPTPSSAVVVESSQIRAKEASLAGGLQSLLDALPSTSALPGSISPVPIDVLSLKGINITASVSSPSTSSAPPPATGGIDYAALDDAGMDMDLFVDGMLAYQQVVEQRLQSSGVDIRSWRLDRPTLRMLFMLLTVNGDNASEIPTRGLPRLTLQGFLFGFLWLGPPWSPSAKGCPPADKAIDWIFSSYFDEPEDAPPLATTVMDETKDGNSNSGRRGSPAPRRAIDIRRCVPDPFYMGPMSRPAAERRIYQNMNHDDRCNALIRLSEGKCDYRNGHGSEPNVTFVFHRKVVESSRQLAASTPPVWQWSHKPQYIWSAACDAIISEEEIPDNDSSGAGKAHQQYIETERQQYLIRGTKVVLKRRTLAQRAQDRRDRRSDMKRPRV